MLKYHLKPIFFIKNYEDLKKKGFEPTDLFANHLRKIYISAGVYIVHFNYFPPTPPLR